MGTGLLLAAALSARLNVLAMGAETAHGLGVSLQSTRLWTGGAILLLVGGAVALAGPINFVGLMVPNAVRAVVGEDQRWLLAYSACYGAVFLLWADLTCRLLATTEVPVGLATALLGCPFFLWLALGRRGRRC